MQQSLPLHFYLYTAELCALVHASAVTRPTEVEHTKNAEARCIPASKPKPTSNGTQHLPEANGGHGDGKALCKYLCLNMCTASGNALRNNIVTVVVV